MRVLICANGSASSLIITDIEDFSEEDSPLKLYGSNSTLGFEDVHHQAASTHVLGEIDMGDFVKLIVSGYKEGMHK